MTKRRVIAAPLFLIIVMSLLAACRRAPPDQPTPEQATTTPETDEATGIAQAATTTAPTAAPSATPSPEPSATAEALPTATLPAPTATTAPAASTNTPPPQPTVTPCGPPAGWVEYIVQQGDTLSRLAQATGTTVAEIQLANCLADTTIFTGNRLFLPVLPATPTPTVTPLAPPPLVLNGSQPQGTAPIVGQLTYDDAYLFRIDARRTGGSEEPGYGIDSVEFRISSSTVSDIYVHTEETPGYCIFGGGEPACNPWPMVDGVYRWGANGPPVEPDNYFVQVVFHFTPESDDGSGITEGFWSFSFDVGAPE